MLHLDQSLGLGLIRSLSIRYSKIFIPSYVIREIARKHRARYNVRHILRQYSFLSRCSIRDEVRVMMLSDKKLKPEEPIDRGEAEAIVQARERSVSVVLVDDAAGRHVAEMHSLRVTGTLGLLKDFKLVGIVENVGPLIEKLRKDVGFRISDSLVRQVLHELGEA